MSVPKLAATLSLVSALLLSYGPAQSAPLTSLSAAAKLGEQTGSMEVRWRGRWHAGGASASPYYYGGSYLGYTYGGFAGYPASGCSFPCWRPSSPYYRPWF
jgi:hypothetical protein